MIYWTEKPTTKVSFSSLWHIGQKKTIANFRISGIWHSGPNNYSPKLDLTVYDTGPNTLSPMLDLAVYDILDQMTYRRS